MATAAGNYKTFLMIPGGRQFPPLSLPVDAHASIYSSVLFCNCPPHSPQSILLSLFLSLLVTPLSTPSHHVRYLLFSVDFSLCTSVLILTIGSDSVYWPYCLSFLVHIFPLVFCPSALLFASSNFPPINLPSFVYLLNSSTHSINLPPLLTCLFICFHQFSFNQSTISVFLFFTHSPSVNLSPLSTLSLVYFHLFYLHQSTMITCLPSATLTTSIYTLYPSVLLSTSTHE